MQGLSPLPPRPQTQIQLDPDVPAYRIIEKRGFVDDYDSLWEKGSMIYWEGKPSMGMEPLNEIAEEKMREHLTHLDGLAQEVNKLKGTGHCSLVNAFEARRRIQEMDRKATRAVDSDEQMPIMGARKHEKKRANSIESGPPPVPLMGHRGHQSAVQARVGRPRKNEGRSAVNSDDKGL